MKRAICLLLLSCSSTNLSAPADAEPPDAAVGEPPTDAAPTVDAPTVADAGSPDVQTADAEPPGLGSACTPHTDSCPTITHPSGDSAPGVCWYETSAMYARCTFECWRFDGTKIVVDDELAQLCAALGGTCKRWRNDGTGQPICFVP